MVIRPPKGLDPDNWIDKVGKEKILQKKFQIQNPLLIII